MEEKKEWQDDWASLLQNSKPISKLMIDDGDYPPFCHTSPNNNKMKKIKIGDQVWLTANAQAMLGLPDGIEYTIDDILKEEDTDYPFCLKSEELGKDWVHFFMEEELILIEE